MSAPLEQRQRQVVPRWRSFEEARRLGELDPLGPPKSRTVPDTIHLLQARENWQEAVEHGDHRLAASWAGDVMGDAMARGEPDRAVDAAIYVLEQEDQAPRLIVSLARRLVHLAGQQPTHLELPVIASREIEHARTQIRNLRHRLRGNPHNPVAWVDLARAYTTTGAAKKATRAMTVALGAGNGNRFVLRSAARLYLHAQEPDLAHQVLDGAGRRSGDPWLLASELAVAHLSGMPLRSTREARRMANDDGFSAFERSELRSAIATLELSAGNEKRARKLFDASLADPHENSLAQVTWASEKTPRVHVPEGLMSTPESYEARAREAAGRGDWSEALEQSLYWLHAEPFSADAAIHASYVATVGSGQHQVAVDITTEALAANPTSAILRNNRAYALANLGRLEDASIELRAMRDLVDDSRLRVPLLATSGLVAYRAGALKLGRGLYREAIDVARTLANREDVLVLAWLHFAHEEARAGGDERDAVVREARDIGNRWRRPDVVALLDRIDAMVPELRE